MRISGTILREEASTDDEAVFARLSVMPANRRELAHCPEAIAAYQERQNATARLAQELPHTPRDVVLGRV